MASVDAVARENGAAIAALGADGIAVFPADDAHAPTWRELAGARRALDLRARRALPTSPAAAVWQRRPLGRDAAARRPARRRFALRVAGRAQRPQRARRQRPAALAAGCPLDAIVRGLEASRAVRGRSQAEARRARGSRASTLVDDTYNANPDSVRAAIDVLAALPAPRWLVLGDMGEVGDQGPAFHREVGAYAQRARHRDALGGGRGEREHGAAFAGARALRRRRRR